MSIPFKEEEKKYLHEALLYRTYKASLFQSHSLQGVNPDARRPNL